MIQAVCWSAYFAYHLAGQKDLPFRPWEEIRRRQSRRIQRMMRYAWRNVPYYQGTMSRLGIRPEQIRNAEDLRKLPVVERSDLQRDPEAFVSRTVNLSRCLRIQSSGSSGAPKTVWHDPASLFQNAAHGERERSMIVRAIGRPNGYRETVIVAPIHPSQKAIQEFVREHGFFPESMRVKRQYLLLSDPPEKNIELINEFRPDLLYAYGSYVEMIFNCLRKRGLTWHAPKAILYSSDHLSHTLREYITGECGIPVFTVYGCVEVLKIAFGCEQYRGLHLNSDLYPVWIADRNGNQSEPGETGEVIVSNLVDRATVLLNYRLGDLASVSAEPCPCGRSLPLISYPVGRVDEVIELPDGSLVHPIAFREVCLREQGILQYQVRQIAPSAFRVSLVAAPEASPRELSQGIRERFRQRFGDAVTAEVAIVDELECTPAGKTPVVISLRRQSSDSTASAPRSADPC